MFELFRRPKAATCLFVGLLSLPLVAHATNGNPFKRIKNAFANIQEQVDDLSVRVETLEGQAQPSGPAAVTVDCAAGQTIAAALATPGTPLTITVVGTCNENVVINRDDVTLTAGAAGAGVNGPSATANAINILADRVTIDGLTVTGGSSGIVATGATRFLLRNCTAGPTPRVGIVAFQGSQGSIENCTVQNNGAGGIAIQSGVATVIGSTISANTGIGININNNAGARIGIANTGAGIGNTITNNTGAGIHVSFASSAYIGANAISGNGVGINVFQAAVDLGFGNNISGNTGNGVQLNGAKALIGDFALGAAPNFISGNGNAGLFLNAASLAAVSNTFIENNTGTGVSVALRSTAQIFGQVRNNNGDGVVLQTGAAAEVAGAVTGNGGWGIRCVGAEASLNTFGPVSGNSLGDVHPDCTGF